jgi:hypothetical protein
VIEVGLGLGSVRCVVRCVVFSKVKSAAQSSVKELIQQFSISSMSTGLKSGAASFVVVVARPDGASRIGSGAI